VTESTVELRIPARGEFLVLARSTAATMAARLDFTLDRLEDLRLAVDEAAALLLPGTPDGADLVCRSTANDAGDGLVVSVHAPRGAGDHAAPGPGTFGWTVLTALTDEVRVEAGESEVTIWLRTARDQADPA
jgi:serine/threonine-protein kinase RsbW